MAKVAEATGHTFERVTGAQPVPQRGKQEYAGGADIVFAFADQSAGASSNMLLATVGKVLGVGGYVDLQSGGIADQGYVVLVARQKLAGDDGRSQPYAPGTSQTPRVTGGEG